MANGDGMIESLSDLKVLAVEDNVEARALLQTTLRELRVGQIFMAKDGKEALDFLGDCDEMINTIICDWNMPRVTGLAFLRQVRTVDPDIPFMMLTGAADHESIRVAKENGVTSYLAKPYSETDLGKKLKRVLRILKFRQAPA